MSDKRKEYWNDSYFEYWKARVDEANESDKSQSSLIENDKVTTTDQDLFDAMDMLEVNKGERVLELGCGYGRGIAYLYEKTTDIVGVDISDAMIDAARKFCKDFKGVSFETSEAETLPFEDNHFDHVVCYGVFDALFQKEALLEMNRVTKTGGTILITGKHDDYFDDDMEALIAERNARKKGHPNYFTDMRVLVSSLNQFGFSLKKARYYLRRGDMNDFNNYESAMPKKFYEYIIIIRKDSEPSDISDIMISDDYSRTFKRVDFK